MEWRVEKRQGESNYLTFQVKENSHAADVPGTIGRTMMDGEEPTKCESHSAASLPVSQSRAEDVVTVATKTLESPGLLTKC